MSSAYLRLLIFLLAIFIPAFDSCSPVFLMMYSAYKLNKQGDNIQPWGTPFPIRTQCIVPWPVLTVASWSEYRFLRRQVRWSGSPISFRIFHSLLRSTQSKAGTPAFSMIQWMLAICSLVPLPFLKPAWTSGILQFMYYWSLAWRILSITILACEMSAIGRQFEHFLAFLSLGLEWKLTFSSPVATAKFSRFAGILSAAFSQDHLLGFEIAQLEFHYLH